MSARVLLVGDLGLDLVVRVPALPRGDEKLTGERVSQAAGGMSANVAVALARLGTASRLVAAIGDDPTAVEVVASLEREGVDVAFVQPRTATATFVCLVLVGPDGEKALVRLPSAAYLPRPDELTPAMFAGVDHLHLTLGHPDLTLRAMALARAVGASVSLDLEVADLPDDPSLTQEVLAGLDLLFLNRAARSALTSGPGGRGLDGPTTVVTTLGADGSLLESAGERIEQPALATEPVDTTGAGDAFAGAFLHHLLGHRRPAEALRFAAAAAALSVRAYGAQAGLPDEEAVRHALTTMKRI